MHPQLIELKGIASLLSIKRNERKKRFSLFASNSDREASNAAKDGKGTKDDLKDLKAEEKNSDAIAEFKNKTELRVAEISKVVFLKPTPEIVAYFAENTRSLIETKSFAMVKSDIKHVDIVKDVINLLPVHWISHIVNVPCFLYLPWLTDGYLLVWSSSEITRQSSWSLAGRANLCRDSRCGAVSNTVEWISCFHLSDV